MVAERKDDVAPELEEFAQKSEVHSIIMQADQEARRRKIAKERAERPAGGGGGDDEEDEEDDPEDVEELRAVKGEEGAGGAASLAVSVHQMGAGADLATLPHCALILVVLCSHFTQKEAAAPKITPFNLSEEREDGHFEVSGNFVWRREREADEWVRGLDKVAITKAKVRLFGCPVDTLRALTSVCATPHNRRGDQRWRIVTVTTMARHKWM